MSDMQLEGGKVPMGAIWSLISAALYSAYLVLIKRKVENEDKMDIPMFFGKLRDVKWDEISPVIASGSRCCKGEILVNFWYIDFPPPPPPPPPPQCAEENFKATRVENHYAVI